MYKTAVVMAVTYKPPF